MVQPFHLRFLLLCLQYDVFTPFPTLPTPRLRPSCFAPDGSHPDIHARFHVPFLWQGFRECKDIFCSFKHSQATVRADIRIRIRRRIIRIRINEPRIRTIIRITAEQHATTPDNPFFIPFRHPGAQPMPPCGGGDFDLRTTIERFFDFSI
jgi:hypothetical protein